MARYKTDYVDIDPDNCPLEELKQKIEELELLSSYFETKQLAIKTFINSVYGATASKYFVGHNTNVAESITLQGQDLNHFSENAVNTYFSGLFQSREEYDKEIYVPIFDYSYRWPIDNAQFYAKDKNKNWVLINLPCSIEDIKTKNISEETEKTLKKHVFVKTTFGEYLNVPYDLVKAFNIDNGRITHQLPLTHESFWVLKDIKDPETGEVIKKEKVHIFNYLEGDKSMTIAGDTDSIYVEFGRLVNWFDISDINRATKFVVDLWEYGCKPFMDKKYNEYAKKFNCDENLQNLEMEKIADTAIMTAKKHYAMSECWLEPNIFLTPGDKVIYKGLEVIQRSTPIYARKCLEDFYRFVMNWYSTNKVQPPFNELYEKIKVYKEGFIQQSPDNICKGQSISDYDKFVIDDNNQLVLGEHIPIHVKGAAIANFILNKDANKKYKVKYNKIKSRDRVKFYYTTDPLYPVFGFLPGKYPLEYAPSIDYNIQFGKILLEPINKILEILGFNKLPADLCFQNALF